MKATLKTLLLSLLALAGGFITLVLVTTVAGWLAPLFGIGIKVSAGIGVGVVFDGTAQLLWDLVFSVLGGIAAVGFTTRYAPCWPRSHGTAIWLLLAAASLWACWSPEYGLPLGFVLFLLVSLPVQLLAGWYIGRRRTP